MAIPTGPGYALLDAGRDEDQNSGGAQVPRAAGGPENGHSRGTGAQGDHDQDDQPKALNHDVASSPPGKFPRRASPDQNQAADGAAGKRHGAEDTSQRSA